MLSAEKKTGGDGNQRRKKIGQLLKDGVDGPEEDETLLRGGGCEDGGAGRRRLREEKKNIYPKGRGCFTGVQKIKC